MIDKEKLNEEIFNNAAFAISMKAPGYFVSIDVKSEMDIEIATNFLGRFRSRLKNRDIIKSGRNEPREMSESVLSPCNIDLAIRKKWRPGFEEIANNLHYNMQTRAKKRRLLFCELLKEMRKEGKDYTRRELSEISGVPLTTLVGEILKINEMLENGMQKKKSAMKKNMVSLEEIDERENSEKEADDLEIE